MEVVLMRRIISGNKFQSLIKASIAVQNLRQIVTVTPLFRIEAHGSPEI